MVILDISLVYYFGDILIINYRSIALYWLVITRLLLFFLLWYYKMPSLTLQLHTKPPPYAFLPFGRRPRSPVNKHAAVRASFPHHCPQQAVAKTFKWTHVPVKVLCSLWLCLCVSLMSPIAVVMCVQAVVNKFPQKPPCVNLIFW